MREKDLLYFDLSVCRSEGDPPRSLLCLGLGRPDALHFERRVLDRQLNVMPTVALSRLSALLCQRHDVNPGRGGWRLVNKVLNRNLKSPFAWTSSDHSDPFATARGQEQGHLRRAWIVVGERERISMHNFSLMDPELGVHNEMGIGLRAVNANVRPDQVATNAVLAFFSDRMSEPTLVNCVELAELHPLVGGLDPAT